MTVKITGEQMKHSKIAIIGAGAVGTTTAYALMLKNITAELILVDIDEIRCKGEVLDLSDALSFCGASKVRSGKAHEAGQADIIIIAAGARQKPGQSRVELVKKNQQVIASIIKSIKPINPNSIVIMVTNPVDVLTYHAQKLAPLPRNQIFGSGTFLDTQRLCGILAKKSNVAEQSIDAFILGEHGDTQFPAWSSAHVGGIPLLSFEKINASDLENIATETKKRAYDIIACKGATYFGIAACVATMCEAIIFDQKLVVPLTCYIPQLDICLSMPCVLGENGIEQILPIPLNNDEQKKLELSVQQLRKFIS